MAILDLIIGPILKIIDKVIPDPAAKAAAQLQILQMQQAGEFKQMDADLAMSQAQNDVNKVEAASPSLFVSGPRPFIMWICATGLGMQFVVGPLFTWLSGLLGHPTPFPAMDLSTMLPMLGGMLGLGTMRTVEKIQGVARP